MTITNKLTAATAVIALAGSGVAAAADAPIVSAQKTSSSRYSPVVIPGTGIKKGERLPKGAKIVYRDITIAPRQEVTITLRAPDGKRVRALAERNTRNVGFGVTHKRSPYGRKHVTLRVFADPDMSGEVIERIYALTR